MDATGFSLKHDQISWHATPITRRRDFLKVHALIHTNTQCFVAWEFTAPRVHDTLILPELLDQVQWPITHVCADAGYLSSKNVHAITSKGATPYVKPKKTTKGRPQPGQKDAPSKRTSEPYRDMVDAYHQNPTKWLKSYSRRNSIESAWGGVKRRFNSTISAALPHLRRTEAALKLIVWNLTRIPQLRTRI